MSPTARRIVECLSRARLPLEDEKALQAAIGDVLARAGIAHVQEKKIAGGVIDFWAPRDSYDGAPAWMSDAFIGIEVKIKGGKRAIWRQLNAYCGDRRLAELIVVTGLPLALPDHINGKPVAIVNLGEAWL